MGLLREDGTRYTLLAAAILIVAVGIGQRISARVDDSTTTTQAASEQASVMAASLARQNDPDLYR